MVGWVLAILLGLAGLPPLSAQTPKNAFSGYTAKWNLWATWNATSGERLSEQPPEAGLNL